MTGSAKTRNLPGARGWTPLRDRRCLGALVVRVALSVFALAGASPAGSQESLAARSLLIRPESVSDSVSGSVRVGAETEFATLGGSSIQPRSPKRAPWWAPLASLIVPGAGQASLGQQRSVAYALAEGYLLVQALEAQRDVNRSIRSYQSIAANSARKTFGGSFPVGPWMYYEDLERFDASGQYDVVPGGVLDPETDLQTFNGQSWLLARQTYWNDPAVTPAVSSPEYQRALAFYAARAWGDQFRWSWRDASLQKGEYKGAVSAANRSNQRKTNILTIVGANHLASFIDAYINVRIRRSGGAGLVGLRIDGIESRVSLVGDPADNVRTIRTSLRFVPAGRLPD
ncbi:MAG TPA: hypothetical protein VE869_17575 [Gemmatimonas sp.]|nr:hypothetical protein [Gemmatimonas sp.]